MLLRNPMFRFCLLLFSLSLFGWGFSQIHSSRKPPLIWTTDESPSTVKIDDEPSSSEVQDDERPTRKGMTWGKNYRDTVLDIDLLGCWAHTPEGAAVGCDAYKGDTPCASSLPILCIKVDGTPRPAYDIHYPSKDNQAYYGGWLNGTATLSPPVPGTRLTSRKAADKICKESLGEGWRMAEHHDGWFINGMSSKQYHHGNWSDTKQDRGGWNFYAYTKNIPATGRYWVAIDDQTANCWD